MNRVLQTFVAAWVVSLLAGCAYHFPPAAPPGVPVDVQIHGMYIKPQNPLPGDRWRAVMTVVNHSGLTAQDVSYAVTIPEKRLEIGRGYINRILPGDDLNISSDDVMLPPGEYHVEGRLYLPTRNPQSGNPQMVSMTVRIGR
jgi:hypothetical protein